MYEVGFGCGKDDALANEWYLVAVKRGSVDALTTLGCREFERKSYAAARELFERAAKLNDPDAMWHLSRMCREGVGGPKDQKRAYTLAHTAAHTFDNVLAWNTLGLLHETGQGCSQDIALAKQCYGVAAKRGFQDAQTNLLRLRNPQQS